MQCTIIPLQIIYLNIFKISFEKIVLIGLLPEFLSLHLGLLVGVDVVTDGVVVPKVDLTRLLQVGLLHRHHEFTMAITSFTFSIIPIVGVRGWWVQL